jgi:hypothetical protein
MVPLSSYSLVRGNAHLCNLSGNLLAHHWLLLTPPPLWTRAAFHCSLIVSTSSSVRESLGAQKLCLRPKHQPQLETKLMREDQAAHAAIIPVGEGEHFPEFNA